jgi:hypothetical protein
MRGNKRVQVLLVGAKSRDDVIENRVFDDARIGSRAFAIRSGAAD